MRLPRDSAFRVAFPYAVVASLWILLSDVALGAVAPLAWERLSIFKGLMFVAVTSLALYALVLRSSSRAYDEAQRAHAAERILDQVVSTVPVGVVLISSDEVVTYMNPAAEALVGSPAEETVGRRFRELLVQQPDVETSAMDMLNGDGAHRAHLAAADGGAGRTVLVHAARIDSAALESGRVLAISDVTDVHRDAAESASQLVLAGYLSEALLACNSESLPRAVMTRVVERAVESGAFAGAWGALRDERTGRFGPPAVAGLDSDARASADLIASGLAEHPSALDRLAVERVIVTNDVGRDPTCLWYPLADHGVRAAATLGVHDAQGPTALLALFKGSAGAFDVVTVDALDVLQGALTLCLERLSFYQRRLVAEEQMEMSEAGYRLLFEKHPLPMWVYDLETLRFLAVNDAAVSKYGWDREEFLGMTIAQIRPEAELERLRENVEHVSEGFEDAGLWTHIDSTGRQFPVHVFSHTIVWEGRPAELVMPQEVATVV